MLKSIFRLPALNRKFRILQISSSKIDQRDLRPNTRNMAEFGRTDDFIDKAEELDIQDRGGRRGNRGGGRGKGRGGKSGGGSGGGVMNREVAVSKALSKLLRHAAEDVGLKLDAEGYARLDDVVSTSTIYLPLSESGPCKKKGGQRQVDIFISTPYWSRGTILSY
jgi:RNA 2'-phosphotransferase, Tpt1 / KptA family